MPLSADAILAIRDWVGDNPTDSVLEAMHTRLGNHDQVVIAIIRNRIAILGGEPASLTVPGLTVSHGVDLEALKILLKEFKGSGGLGLDETPLSVGAGTGTIRRRWRR